MFPKSTARTTSWLPTIRLGFIRTLAMNAFGIRTLVMNTFGGLPLNRFGPGPILLEEDLFPFLSNDTGSSLTTAVTTVGSVLLPF